MISKFSTLFKVSPCEDKKGATMVIVVVAILTSPYILPYSIPACDTQNKHNTTLHI